MRVGDCDRCDVNTDGDFVSGDMEKCEVLSAADGDEAFDWENVVEDEDDGSVENFGSTGRDDFLSPDFWSIRLIAAKRKDRGRKEFAFMMSFRTHESLVKRSEAKPMNKIGAMQV
jgi:hypothetical protein